MSGRAAWQDVVDSLQEGLLAAAHRNVPWSLQVWKAQVVWSFRVTALDRSRQKRQLGQTFNSLLPPPHPALPHPSAPSSPAENTAHHRLRFLISWGAQGVESTSCGG